MRRLTTGALGALLLLVLGTGIAAAGGWATIVPDDPAPPEPVAGDEFVFGFTVMQHGETPAGWEQPTLRLTDALTGETIEVRAAPSGEPGHFEARVTLKAAGLYTWEVALRDLVVTTSPTAAVVLEPDGSRPTLELATILTLVERARAGAAEQARLEIDAATGELHEQISRLEARDAALRAELSALTEQLAATSAAGSDGSGAADASADGPMLPLGVITLAVLAGAIAGFAMSWLGGRRPPASVELPTGRPVVTG